MSRAKVINLSVTAALASALLGGCAQERAAEWGDEGDLYADGDTAICVDGAGERIDDDYCDDDSTYRGGGSFIYLGRGGYIPYYGERPRPGTYSRTPRVGAVYGRAPAVANMTRSAAVSRGGFGSSARSGGGWSSGRS